jgi:hypothetical protein
MLEELRLNPRAPGARSWGRRPGDGAATDVGGVGPGLSTGFADHARVRSTGRAEPIHTLGVWIGVG